MGYLGGWGYQLRLVSASEEFLTLKSRKPALFRVSCGFAARLAVPAPWQTDAPAARSAKVLLGSRRDAAPADV